MKPSKGFTLIELMIVVVIVAILAAVALPSYQDSVRKSRRADAKDALTRIAGAQERYFFTNNGYATTVAALGFSNTSSEGYYNGIKITDLSGTDFSGAKAECTSGGVTYPCFRVEATAAGAQAKDTLCTKFTMTHNGLKAATNSADGDSTDDCW